MKRKKLAACPPPIDFRIGKRHEQVKRLESENKGAHHTSETSEAFARSTGTLKSEADGGAMKTVSYWVHASYSRDLQKLGYAPEERGLGPFDRYTLSEEDWGAFCALYDPPPHLYKEPV